MANQATLAFQRIRAIPIPDYFIAFGLVLGLSLLIRWPLIHEYIGFTSDMGSHLMTRNWVLGDDPTGQKLAHFRPPLYGLLLIPFTWALGDLDGAKALAILASVFLAIPFYGFARRWLSPWWAVMASAAFINFPALAAITAGNQITLVSLMLALWGWHWLLDAFEGKGNIWRTAIPVSLLMGTNQTVIQMWFIVAPLLWLRAPYIKRGLWAMVIAGVACTPWLYFYLVHLPGTHALYVPGAPFLAFDARYDVTVQLIVVALSCALAPQRNRYFFIPAFVLGLMGHFTSGDVLLNNTLGRATYILPIFTVLAPLNFIQQSIERGTESVKRWQGIVAASATALVLVLGNPLWLRSFEGVARPLDMLTPDNLAAVYWIRDNTPNDSTVYAHPQGLAWWVGGLARRAWYGSWYQPLKEFEEEENAFKCALGWRLNCDPLELREVYGVDYLLIDEASWFIMDGIPDGGYEITRRMSWLREAVSVGEVRVYEWANAP